MDWTTVLRVLFIIAMVVGTWRSIKAMGRPVMYEGRRYYRQPDGSFRRWYGGSRKQPSEIGL